MRLLMGVALGSVGVVLLSACSASTDPGLTASSGTHPSTTTSNPETAISISPGTTSPTSELIDLELTGYSWMAGPEFQTVSSDITFGAGGRSVTAAFGGESQYGQLTEFGVSEIGRFVSGIRPGEIPDTFAGPERSEGVDESWTITLRVDGSERVFRYTGAPPPQLRALHEFLWNQVLPLSSCQPSDAVEVQEPCVHLSAF
ncbi:MAG: hypothetical protein ABIJ75_12125 [Actinomycetota bacterium]|nr:hypothetical protein [Actinomycetota bacterium]